MSTDFSLCSGVRIVRTHFAGNLFLPNISIKTVWTEPELMHIDLSIYWTLRRLSSRSIRWIASTCSPVVEAFGGPDRLSSSVLSLHQLNSTVQHDGPQQVSTACPRGFPWVSYLSSADNLWLLGPLCCPFLDLSHASQLYMGFTCAEIKTKNLIIFLVL